MPRPSIATTSPDTRVGCATARPRAQVLQGHYYEQREFQEVATVMGISKGRVSQLHARALAKIREWLNARPKIDLNL